MITGIIAMLYNNKKRRIIMKKLSMLLALVMVLSCFALVACNEQTEESNPAESVATSETESKTESKTESETESEPVSEDESEPVSEDESEPVSEDEEISFEPGSGELEGSLASSGATYEVSGIGTGYGNYTADLTDGVTTDALSYDNAWFALYYNGDNSVANAPDGVGTITVDLGEVKSNVNYIKVHMVAAETSGIVNFETLHVAISADGSNFTTVGEFTKPETTDPTWVELSIPGADAQYVRIIADLGGVFMFLDEIEVYAD